MIIAFTHCTGTLVAYLSFVQSLGGFMKTTGKSIMNESGLEDLSESSLEVHATSEVISGGSADCKRKYFFLQKSQYSVLNHLTSFFYKC